jgi:PAS domain-containing protein
MANPSHHNKDFSNKEGSHLPPELPQNIIAAAKEILDISRLNLSWDFMEVIPAPVFVKDLEHRYIACNRQFLDILSCKGYGSVLGKTTGELIGKTNAEDHFTSDRQVILSGNEITYESSFPGDTEKVRIALITKSPLKLSDGSISAIAGIITDISRLKALQVQQAFHNSQLEIQVARRTEELEQKNSRLLSEIAEKVSIQQEMLRFENRLEVALKALKAGAWELEPHSGKLEWSSKCYEIFDIEPGPVSPEKWMGKVHPEDIDRVKTQWSRISARMGWFELDFRIMAYGKPHWIRKSGYYLPGSHENGERITGVMADISEEKYFNDRLLDSQRFFKAIVEDQTELICRIRPDGSFTFVNRG